MQCTPDRCFWWKELKYITFPGSKVSRTDCGMCNMAYEYKNIFTVQLKFSDKKTQETKVFTCKAITFIYMNHTVNLILFTQLVSG
jgi:hypothetical protein